jgi:hypothetical protein
MPTYTSGSVTVTAFPAFVYSTGNACWVTLIQSGHEILPRAVLTDYQGQKVSGEITVGAVIWEDGQSGFTAQGDFGAPFPVNARVLPKGELSGTLEHRLHPHTPNAPILENALVFGGLAVSVKTSGVIYSINPDAITIEGYQGLLPAHTIPVQIGNPQTINMTTSQDVAREPILEADSRVTGVLGRTRYAGLGRDTRSRVVE